MPLWKLQTLRRRNVPFLYEKSSGPRITLLPGVAFNLRRFGALIQLLARSAWVQHIRSNPRNAPTVGGATDLELFLFGGARVDLSAARGALQDIQENRCFYCGSAMKQDPHVHHFIPWSRLGGRPCGAPVAGGIPGRSTRGAAGGALGLRPSRGHVGAALGEFEIHGKC
jgi:hypothetical protein